MEFKIIYVLPVSTLYSAPPVSKALLETMVVSTIVTVLSLLAIPAPFLAWLP